MYDVRMCGFISALWSIGYKKAPELNKMFVGFDIVVIFVMNYRRTLFDNLVPIPSFSTKPQYNSILWNVRIPRVFLFTWNGCHLHIMECLFNMSWQTHFILIPAILIDSYFNMKLWLDARVLFSNTFRQHFERSDVLMAPKAHNRWIV